MTNNNFGWCKQLQFFTGLAILAFLVTSCSKMNDTYHNFWENGEEIYPASPDSVHVYTGNNRIQLSWIILGDPSIDKAKIYWNNKTDSVIVPVRREGNGHVDTIKVILDNMPEGFYSFDIYAYDDKGNQSVVANAIGRSYGQSYSNSLLSRLVDSAYYLHGIATLVWGNPPDKTSIGVELEYMDTTGATRQLFIDRHADSTFISDFVFTSDSMVRYRTLFVPDSMSIDTFYTKYDTVQVPQVVGPRTELPKTGWSATASSYDGRNGDDRKPFSAIDNNNETMWVNQVAPQTYFPHTLTVDMGTVHKFIYGVSLYLIRPNETPRDASIYISNDGTTWQFIGLFSIEHPTGTHYLDFSAPQSFRYVRAVFGSAYNSNNIVINEMGVFTR